MHLLNSLNGIITGRNEDGNIVKNPFKSCITALQQDVGHISANFPDKIDLSIAKPMMATENGDCGSLYIVTNAPFGVVILGHHFMGNPSDGDSACSLLTSTYLSSIIREGFDFTPAPIELNSHGTEHVLSALHSKSPIRWISEGHADIHGSIIGFRGAMKSRVTKTLFAKYSNQMGYKFQGGAPVMKGWQPWRTALLGMLDPAWKFNESILEKCADVFFDDICRNLKQEDFDMLHTYDDFTTVNGHAGVAYVDSINRSSSMGFPWCKSKKFFLKPDIPCDRALDPVKFDEQFMSRVRRCEELYDRKRLYRPIFSMSLKDEVVKQSKIDENKTRGINAAPADWSFVVRKHLLSFVRLVQNNKFVFETGVGTVAQSLEWQEIS